MSNVDLEKKYEQGKCTEKLKERAKKKRKF